MGQQSRPQKFVFKAPGRVVLHNAPKCPTFCEIYFGAWFELRLDMRVPLRMRKNAHLYNGSADEGFGRGWRIISSFFCDDRGAARPGRIFWRWRMRRIRLWIARGAKRERRIAAGRRMRSVPRSGPFMTLRPAEEGSETSGDPLSDLPRKGAKRVVTPYPILLVLNCQHRHPARISTFRVSKGRAWQKAFEAGEGAKSGVARRHND
jgi:hypothetical protein